MMFGLEVMINCMGQVAIQCLMVLQGVPNVDEQIREMCFLWVGFELFAQLFGQNFYASGCEWETYVYLYVAQRFFNQISTGSKLCLILFATQPDWKTKGSPVTK